MQGDFQGQIDTALSDDAFLEAYSSYTGKRSMLVGSIQGVSGSDLSSETPQTPTTPGNYAENSYDDQSTIPSSVTDREAFITWTPSNTGFHRRLVSDEEDEDDDDELVYAHGGFSMSDEDGLAVTQDMLDRVASGGQASSSHSDRTPSEYGYSVASTAYSVRSNEHSLMRTPLLDSSSSLMSGRLPIETPAGVLQRQLNTRLTNNWLLVPLLVLLQTTQYVSYKKVGILMENYSFELTQFQALFTLVVLAVLRLLRRLVAPEEQWQATKMPLRKAMVMGLLVCFAHLLFNFGNSGGALSGIQMVVMLAITAPLSTATSVVLLRRSYRPLHYAAIAMVLLGIGLVLLGDLEVAWASNRSLSALTVLASAVPLALSFSFLRQNVELTRVDELQLWTTITACQLLIGFVFLPTVVFDRVPWSQVLDHVANSTRCVLLGHDVYPGDRCGTLLGWLIVRAVFYTLFTIMFTFAMRVRKLTMSMLVHALAMSLAGGLMAWPLVMHNDAASASPLDIAGLVICPVGLLAQAYFRHSRARASSLAKHQRRRRRQRDWRERQSTVNRERTARILAEREKQIQKAVA